VEKEKRKQKGGDDPTIKNQTPIPQAKDLAGIFGKMRPFGEDEEEPGPNDAEEAPVDAHFEKRKRGKIGAASPPGGP
jgi:hypothetical protein